MTIGKATSAAVEGSDASAHTASATGIACSRGRTAATPAITA